MAKKIFKRWLPQAHDFHSRPGLKFMGFLLKDPNLFHLNRHSVAGAFFIGLFIAFLPSPGQMPLAALLAFLFRVNVPIAVALVFVSNPLTMPPLFFLTYELGRWILGSPAIHFTFDLSWEWLNTEFPRLWQPLLIGSLLTGLVMGGLGYISIMIFWRWHVLSNWKLRQKRRAAAKQDKL